nr:adenosine receptor A2b-like [Lytechinus pictus]
MPSPTPIREGDLMRRIEPVTLPNLSKPTTSSGATRNGANGKAARESDDTKTRASDREAEAADTARRRQKRFQAYKKDLQAVKSVAVIVLVFMMCWLPLSLSNSVSALFGSTVSQPYKVIQTCIILSHMNSAINPFLYAYGKEFRMGYKRAFAKMFPCMCALKPQDSATGTKAVVNAVSGVANGLNYSTNDS